MIAESCREQIGERFRAQFIDADAVQGFQAALLGAIDRARRGMAPESFRAG